MLERILFLLALVVMMAIANAVAQLLYPTLRYDDMGRRISYRVVVWIVFVLLGTFIALAAWVFGALS